MKYKDYYSVLGLPHTATPDEVRKAYRAMARKHHPDVDKSPDATRRFQEISEAHEVLSDPEQRARFDQLGTRWRDGDEIEPPAGDASAPRWRNAHRAADMDGFSDFFRTFFAADGGRFDFSGIVDEGLPIHEPFTALHVRVGPETLVRGGESRVEFEVGGEGRFAGVLRIPPATAPETELLLSAEPAARSGRARKDVRARTFRAHIELELPGGLEREHDDLVTRLDVAPHEAALGARVSMALPGGGSADLSIPACSSSGRRLRLRGQGIPREDGGRGDLLVELRIVLPRELSPDERRLYGELARAPRAAPRA
ncbi:MAG: DnaJ domain-containing protein [Planctomycetes bacterium]|nr:DnaJ domain-containing protein [Planctomycetota bacterium]